MFAHANHFTQTSHIRKSPKAPEKALTPRSKGIKDLDVDNERRRFPPGPSCPLLGRNYPEVRKPAPQEIRARASSKIMICERNVSLTFRQASAG